MPNWKKLITSGSDASLNSLTAKTLTLSTLSTQASEATALMINDSSVVGTRELGSNAFTSTAYQPAGNYLLDTTDTLTGDLTVTGKVIAGTDPKTSYDVNVGTLGIGVDRTNGITFTGASVLGSKIFADTFSNLIFSTRLTSTPYTLNQRMIIENSTGNVGIGTTNPESRLHLYELGVDSPTTLILENGDVGINDTEDVHKIEFQSNDLSDFGVGVAASIRVVAENAGNKYGLAFNTQNAADRGERVRIDGAGNVGIGVLDPGTSLDVNGTIQASSAFQLTSGGSLTSNSGDLYIYNTTAKDILLGGGVGGLQNDVIIGNGDLTLTGSGNKIGIGISIPESLLHISSGTTGDAVIIIESDTDNAGSEDDNPRVDFYQDNRAVHSKIGINGSVGSSFTNALDNAGYFGTPTGHPLQLFTNNIARLTITSGGNVGIGTSNPDGKLHIDGITSASPGVVLEALEGVSNNKLIDIHNTSGAKRFGIEYDNTSIRLKITNRSGDIIASFIEGTKNVGIGTTSPGEKLSVVGNILGSGCITIGAGHTNSGVYSSINGGCINNITNSTYFNSSFSTIGGGCNNSIIALLGTGSCYSTIGGGANNTVTAAFSTIGGGSFHTASGASSTIGGGNGNYVLADNSTISGGYCNIVSNGTTLDLTAISSGSTIGGGSFHTSSGAFGTVSGGCQNVACLKFGTVGGGSRNCALEYTTVSGGFCNRGYATHGTIGGGCFHCLGSGAGCSTIGGGSRNCVPVWGIHSTIGGGQCNTVTTLTGNNSHNTIAGGLKNTICGASGTSFIGGGDLNQNNGTCRSFIGGGVSNTITTSNCSGILGGSSNSITSTNFAFVIGNGITALSECTTSFNNTTCYAAKASLNYLGTAATAGEIVYFGSASTVAGSLYYYNSAAGWTAADADTATTGTGLLAIALGTTSNSDGMLVRGFARFTSNGSYTGLTTRGAKLYISNTAGAFTQTAPTGATDIVRIIGYVVNIIDDLIYFCPDNSYTVV